MVLSKKQKDWWLTGFSADAQAVFDLMDSDPPAALKTIMATFIDSQVAIGNWAVMIQFVLYGMDTAGNSVINWKSTSFNALNVGSPHTVWSGPAHSGFAGFSPDGATLYVNSGIAPDDIGQDDVRFGVWMFTNDDGAGNNVLMGTRDVSTDDAIIFRQFPGTRLIIQVNCGLGNQLFYNAEDVFADNTFHEIVRPDSSNQAYWRAGVQRGTGADASQGRSSHNIYDGANNNQGTASLELDCNITARLATANTGFDGLDFYTNLLIMLQSMGIEA